MCTSFQRPFSCGLFLLRCSYFVLEKIINNNNIDINIAILEDINYKLTWEDQTLRTFRRAIGFGQNVRSDLIPLLENSTNEDVFDAVVRILVNLTVPVECLFSVDVMYRTEMGRHTIYEVNKLLHTSKGAFTDPKSTKCIVEHIKHILESDCKLSTRKCDQINNCLLLLRNVLHIPEANVNYLVSSSHNQTPGSQSVSMQNVILWNLFIQSIDKLLLYLMTCPQRSFWGVSIVQLIAVIYKDQHAGTLQKLLNMWFEASLSESSEDNESNTSPPKQNSCNSSPIMTSDPTSDSSDNGSAGCNNVSPEDRRQALRDETEATLQEVSRKGQEYQDSMLRVPADKVDSSEGASDMGTTDCEESACALAEPKTKTKMVTDESDSVSEVSIVEAMEAAYEEEGGYSDVTVIYSSNSLKEDFTQNIDRRKSTLLQSSKVQQQEQPAEQLLNTTNTPSNCEMPPPALPIKGSSLAHASSNAPVTKTMDTLKMCQKAPHSGRLNLTKGKCGPQKRECPSSQSELSDCGYGTQVENQESISTSSDDGPQDKPQHQKPPCNSKPRNKQRTVLIPLDNKDLRRKKLVKRSKSSLINMKGLVQHTPTDDDISNLLKEFTVDFLLKGYGFLVSELHTQLLGDMNILIDTSHFFWLITYFLKFAAQLELDMEHISSILTYDVISYLTYEGVLLCEQLELNARQEGSDLKPYLRRMHLAVTAIREFVQAIETYKKVTHLSEDDREHLRHLQAQISGAEDLRNLFVLLIRRFNPNLQNKQYLQDLVVTNHVLLLILDSVTRTNNSNSNNDANKINVKMLEHVSQFATQEVMHFYGLLLEDFDNNGEYVNDCIFNMMHHIAGDLGQIGMLFQPHILKTYLRIWEADYQLCDDWSDLIEYVIHKAINTPQKNALTLPTASFTELNKESNIEAFTEWTKEEKDTLYWYYVQSKKSNDVVGKIVSLFSNNGNKQKSRISIIRQLLQQDIITIIEHDDLMKFEDAEYQRSLLTTPTSGTTESGIDMKGSTASGKSSDDIQILLDLLVREKKQQDLVWLQKLLLECCFVKLMLRDGLQCEDRRRLKYVMEPVAYHCILKNKPIPLVQWNNEQTLTMLHQPFLLLLHKLGFQLPDDGGSIFARIPNFWTPEMMYTLVKKLGSLDKLLIKFDTNKMEGITEHKTNQNLCKCSDDLTHSASNLELEILGKSRTAPSSQLLETNLEKSANTEIFAVPKTKHSNSIIRFTPDPAPTPSIPEWLQVVMRSKFHKNNITPNNNLGSNNMAAVNLMQASATDGYGNGTDSDIYSTINNTSNASATLLLTNTKTTTSISHIMTAAKATCSNSSLPNNNKTSAAAVATTTTTTTLTANKTILHYPPTPLPCPSINNNIIGLQHESNNLQSNESNHKTNNMTGATINNTTITTIPTLPIEKLSNSSLLLTTTSSSLSPLSIITSTTAVTAAATMPTTSLIESPTTVTNSSKEFKYDHNTTQQQKQHCFTQSKQQSFVSNDDDDDSAMPIIERKDSYTSDFYSMGSTNGHLEQEYCAMVASVYGQEMANDCASVASDLTRMYVSDEDDKHEYRVADHYH
ncbi:timeless isoform 2-T2 [Glossina fuscipes fuscipes]